VLIAAVLALLIVPAVVVTPGTARAAGDEVVNIPDPNLKAAINLKLGHPAAQDVTEAEALTVTGIDASSIGRLAT